MVSAPPPDGQTHRDTTCLSPPTSARPHTFTHASRHTCTHVHTCTHAKTHVHTETDTHSRTFTHACAHTQSHRFTHMHPHTPTQRHTHPHSHVCAQMLIHTHVRTYMFTHAHVHSQASLAARSLRTRRPRCSLPLQPTQRPQDTCILPEAHAAVSPAVPTAQVPACVCWVGLGSGRGSPQGEGSSLGQPADLGHKYSPWEQCTGQSPSGSKGRKGLYLTTAPCRLRLNLQRACPRTCSGAGALNSGIQADIM